MKKIAFSVMATGSLAFIVGAGDAEASTSYTVKSGDTLWKIASSNQVSVVDLKNWNQLASDTIYPSQVLKLNQTGQQTESKPTVPNTSKPSTPSSINGTYTVKSGDTLSKIASQYKTTVGAIQRLNNIPSHLIFVGQTLKINGVPPTTNKPAEPKPTPPAPSTPSAPTGSYTVVKGDTLSSIAYRHGISVTQLQNWNNIKSHMIYVGQALKIENRVVESQPSKPPVVTTPPSQSGNGSINSLTGLAMSLQGTPYVWGGSSPSGFDCSGFLYYVYSKSGIDVPRTNTVGFHARSYDVDTPKVGDIVFFSNTYTSGISHAGIYLGNNQFIHAGGDRVQVSSLSESYWKKHFDGFKRLYAM